MSTDPSAVADSIIVHAETPCEREDLLWDVIRHLSIPVDDLICDDSTFLRAIKKIATHEESNGQLTFAEFEDDDSMPEIDLDLPLHASPTVHSRIQVRNLA